MVKMTVEIDQEAYQTLRQIAKAVGLKTEKMLEQMIDRDLIDMNVWFQRFDMIQHKDEKQDQTKTEQLGCPDCKRPLKIERNHLACVNKRCRVIAVRASGKIIRSSIF